MLGLLGYAVGALAMTLAQSLTAIIIFWAVVGGIGASLLLPAMQSLIHGNFEERPRPRPTQASRGGVAAIAAAVGPCCSAGSSPPICRGGSGSCSRSSSSPSRCPASAVRDALHRLAVDVVGAVLSVLGMGGVVLGILVWQEGGESVAALLAVGVVGLAALVASLRRRKRQASRPCSTPTCLGPSTSGLGSPSSCSSRSPSAAR